MKHHETERHLYDHVAGTLDAALRAEVDAHLAGCERCRAERAALAHTIDLLPPDAPGERLDAAYWTRFANEVEGRVRAERRPARTASFWDGVRMYVLLHRAPSFAAAAACVVLLAGLFYLGRLTAPAPPPSASPSITGAPADTVLPASERFDRYLRKSKVLLVGIANMKSTPGRPVDLRAEREASRSLIKEARYLQGQDIDRRSARLVDDLNRILIELANLEDEHDLPDVEIIRGGIHQENLLFKIRMAEMMHDSTTRHDTTF